RLDGGYGGLHDLRDLAVAHALMIGKNHRDALLLRQSLHRSLEKIGNLVALDDRACIGLLVGDLGYGVDIFGSRLAPEIDGTVADDAIEPGREFRAALLPLTTMRPDLEHRVLHHVLGVCRVTDDAQ